MCHDPVLRCASCYMEVIGKFGGIAQELAASGNADKCKLCKGRVTEEAEVARCSVCLGRRN